MDVEHPTPVVSWQLVEGKGVEDPGIAYHRVKPSELLRRPVHDGCRAVGAFDRVVRSDRNPSLVDDLRHNPVGDPPVTILSAHRDADVIDHDRSPPSCQIQGIQRPKPRPAPVTITTWPLKSIMGSPSSGDRDQIFVPDYAVEVLWLRIQIIALTPDPGIGQFLVTDDDAAVSFNEMWARVTQAVSATELLVRARPLGGNDIAEGKSTVCDDVPGSYRDRRTEAGSIPYECVKLAAFSARIDRVWQLVQKVAVKCSTYERRV